MYNTVQQKRKRLGPSRRRPVTPPERRQWLEKLEGGQGITRIAIDAKRDVRVVKRGIEQARQEGEATQARQGFLKDRLEQHQQALLEEVQRLRGVATQGQVSFLEPEESLKRKVHLGLMDHVERTPLGRMVTEYREMAEGYRKAHSEVENEVQAAFRKLLPSVPPGVMGDSWPTTVLWVVEDVVAGKAVWSRDYEKAPHEGAYHLHWMGRRPTSKPLDEETFPRVATVHENLMDVAELWLPRMTQKRQELKALGVRLADGLEDLLVKGLVSGRCRYCPV